MKKITLLCLTLFILTTLVGQSDENTRSINWIHGFVGAESSWQTMDNMVKQNYNVVTKRIYYPSLEGIDKCAEVALPQLLTIGKNPIVIAHSMGGLVTRKMCELGANIGAYATFGTPHDGAHFANSYMNGDIKEFTSELTEEVFSDVLGAIFTPFSVSIQEYLFELFGWDDPHQIGKIIFRFIEYYVKNKTDEETIIDLKNKGSFVNNLAEPDIPKVNFYGVENSPVHWRFLGNFIDSEANDDLLVDKIDQLHNLYETIFLVSAASSNICLSYPAVFIPSCFFAGIYSGNLAAQISQAMHTLDQSEASWLALIGGIGGYYQECYTDEKLVGWDYNRDGLYDEQDKAMRDSCLWTNLTIVNSDSVRIELDIQCTDENVDVISEKRPDPCHDFTELFEEQTDCYDVYYGKKNDGFIVYNVTGESESLAWTEIPGLNHQELKNHIKTKQTLLNLFDNDDFFSLEKFEIFKLERN